jgi:cytolysin (calcineurin-like family phosphatase)
MKTQIVSTSLILVPVAFSCVGCSQAVPGGHDDRADASATPAETQATQRSALGRTGANDPFDITFFVMADSHADPVPEDDLLSQARAINAVARSGVWPASIGGTPTNFVGGRMAPPLGVVILGDLTGWGTAPTEIPMFRSYFEQGNSPNGIHYPAYLGLGNHDIDTADRDQGTANAYRAAYWQYIDSRHAGAQAPVPVTNFDPASHNYSWDWAGVHLIMTHRFAGDTEYGLPSSLEWLAGDLRTYASDGRPVITFHHYGMDGFGTNGQWWTAFDRANYRGLLTGYHVAAIMTGHTHYAFGYSWEGLNVMQVNNAKAEINKGNNDGNGSFAIVRITNHQLDIVTCRWTDDQGGYELIAPFYSGPSDTGPAQPSTLAGFYTVVNQNSGQCLDDAGWGTTPGTPVIQWDCGDQQSNQEWQLIPTDSGYYQIVNRFSSFVLDVSGGPGATDNWVKVLQWTYWGGANQQWRPESLGGNQYRFIARHSGRCLDVPGASRDHGVQLQQYDCNGTGAQSFSLVPQP